MGATIDNAPHSTPIAASGAPTISFSMANILSGNVASTSNASESATAPGHSSVSWDNLDRCWVRTGALEVHRGLGNNGRSDFHPYLPVTSGQHSNTLRQFVDRGWTTSSHDQFALERNQTNRNQVEPVILATRTRKIKREDSGYHSERSIVDSTSHLKKSTPSSNMPISLHHSLYDNYPISIGQYSPTIPQSGSPDSFSISCGSYSPSDQSTFSSMNSNGKQVNVDYPSQVVSPDMHSNGYISGSDGSLSPTERNYPVGDLVHVRSSGGCANEEASAPSDNAESQCDEPSLIDVEGGLHSEGTDGENSTVEHHADNQDVEGSSQRNARRSNESPEKGAPKKKRRVLFTKEQTSELERLFVANHYVVPQDRDAIAKKLNMHPDQVKIWFQNHRYKLKKFVDDMKAKGIPYYVSLRVPKESLRAESFLSSFQSAQSRLSADSLAYSRLVGPAATSAFNLVSSPYAYPSQPMAPMAGSVPYYPDPYHCGTLPLHPYEGRMLTHYGNSPVPTASARVPHPYPYPNMLHVPVLSSPYQALHKPLIRL